MKKVTPVIKRTRVIAERYEVCPHCQEEIREKSTYMDADNFVYHRACIDKGPIDQITPQKMEAAWNKFMGKAPMPKAAQAAPSAETNHAGKIRKNIAGKEYIFTWHASKSADGNIVPDGLTVDKPAELPEDLWYQVGDAIREEAKKAAMAAARPHIPVAASTENWFTRAAQSSDVEFEGGEDDTDEAPSQSSGSGENADDINDPLAPSEGMGLRVAQEKGSADEPLDYEWWMDNYGKKVGNRPGNISRKDGSPIDVDRSKAIQHSKNRRAGEENTKNYIAWIRSKVSEGCTLDNNIVQSVAVMILNTEGREQAETFLASVGYTKDPTTGRWTRPATKTAAKKVTEMPPKGEPIDDALLADGLGAFLEVFVNYHSGREGDKLAKWIIALCKDPKFATIAEKLRQFHQLMGEIYNGVVEIAKAEPKVAAALAKLEKTAYRPKEWHTGSPGKPWHDFQFDGLTLSWVDKQGQNRETSYTELAAWVRTNLGIDKWSKTEGKLPTGEEIKVFVDTTAVGEDPLERLIPEKIEYLGIIFYFETAKGHHQIRFFHNGEGKVEF